MNSGDMAPMIVMVTAILTSGGVLLFRPLAKRMAELLHVMTQERLMPGSGREVAQLNETIARLESRLSLLEERQGFTESILDARSIAPVERPSHARGAAAAVAAARASD
jgi:hypothetical protein